MSTLPLVFRDATPNDIEACLALDHTYETDTVWQMHIRQEVNGWDLSFRTERLPRQITLTYSCERQHLEQALPPQVCFLVAVNKADETVQGYLLLRPDALYNRGIIQQIIVNRPLRRQKIATRLLGIARRWAQEHQLRELILQTQTKNYPSIVFAQAAGLAFCGFNDRYYPNHDIAVYFGQALR